MKKKTLGSKIDKFMRPASQPFTDVLETSSELGRGFSKAIKGQPAPLRPITGPELAEKLSSFAAVGLGAASALAPVKKKVIEEGVNYTARQARWDAAEWGAKRAMRRLDKALGAAKYFTKK